MKISRGSGGRRPTSARRRIQERSMRMRKLSRVSRPILLVLAGLFASPPAGAQVDVLTHRYDNARSGTNLEETQLKTSNVKNNTFGKLAFRIVDGNVYAQ